MTYGPPPPEDAERLNRRAPRLRDVASVALIGTGTVTLMMCLYLLDPLAAASAVCVAVIIAGVLVGME